MKVGGIVFCLLAILLWSSRNIFGRIVVSNKSNYEVKVAVTIVGVPDWACFPKNSVSKFTGIDKTQFVPGLLPDQSASFSKDASNVKKDWKVWAKIDGVWKKNPVAVSSNSVTGGIIIPVRAYVFNTVDDDSNEPVFSLVISQGW